MATVTHIIDKNYPVYATGDQNISGIKTFVNNINVSGTGIFNAIDLNNIDILSLSGVDINLTNANVISNYPIIGSNLVYNTGNQSISGNKTFLGNLVINNLTVTGVESIVNISNVNIGSNYLLLNVTGGSGVIHGPASDGGIFFVTGEGKTGINDTGAILGFDSPANKWVFGTASRNDDIQYLNEIASVSIVQQLSGNSVPFNGNRAIKRQGSFYNINAGGTTISGFLNNLLFPFIQGSIYLNSISLQEKGTTLTTVPFIGSITANDDTITNLKYKIGANQVGTTVSTPGSSFSYSATSQSITSTTTISAEASSANNGSPTTISSSQTINFEAPYYYGVGAANLTVAQIKALNKVLTYQPSSITQTFTTNNNYFYLAYPTNWGNLTSIKDSSNLSLFNDFTKTTNSTTFTLVDNSSLYSYNIYVFNNASTVSNYQITFNF